MVPLFIAILLVGVLLFKKMNRGGAVKKILIRIGFLGLGLPLMGMMYTGMVDSMAASAESGNAGATRVVMSTYVDFENWAMKSRLAVPADATIAWSTSSNSPTGEAQREVRNTALAINNQTLDLGLDPIVTGGSYDASWANQAIEGGEDEKRTTQNTYLTVVNVLVRYIANAQVSAASFETQAQGQLTKSSYYKAMVQNRSDEVTHWFESIVKKDAKALNNDLTAASGANISPVNNPVISVNGGLRASGISGDVTFTSDVSGCFGTGTWVIVGSDPSPRSCNLSPLAMYNYLNTDFGSTSMTMYSSSNAMSEATRSIHNSVNQVGTGTMSALYWLNTVVLLGAFVLIGFGYAFAILFANIRRSFQILTSIPFATLGAIAAIAKVIVYTVALVLEVIITIFLYKIIQEFLISIPQIIEMPFALALNNGAGGDFAGFVAFLTNGWAFGLIVTLLSIIGIIAFTVMAMRSRKAIVKAMEEAVTKIVEKFTETSIGSPGGGKMAPALAGGLAAGAGAAAANRMMGGSMTKDAKGAGLPGAGGPEGVSTEAGGAGGTAGSNSSVSGEIETGDGTLGIEGGVNGPADGNGDPGSPLALTAGPGGESGAAETAEGKRVEAEGLSQDGGAGEAGGTNGRTFEADSEGQVREAQAQPDAGDAAAASLEESAEGYKEADKKKLAVGKEGAEATGHAALAVGKGFAGDAAGAAESGGRAVEHGGKAVAAGEQAKHAEKEAGRSSLDKPDQKHAQRAAKAEQVSQAGGMVANAAGAASATSGGGAAKGAQGASKRAGQQAGKQPRPAQAQAPRPQQVKPSAQPRPARPQQVAPQTVVNKSSSVTNSTDRRSKTVNKPRKPKPIRPSGTGKSSGGKGKGSGK